jgi:hypothetical protein
MVILLLFVDRALNVHSEKLDMWCGVGVCRGTRLLAVIMVQTLCGRHIIYRHRFANGHRVCQAGLMAQ